MNHKEKYGLTVRELEVLAHIAMGRSAKMVAAILTNQRDRNGEALSIRTVQFHLANAYERLDVCNAIQAINKVRAAGIDLDSYLDGGPKANVHIIATNGKGLIAGLRSMAARRGA